MYFIPDTSILLSIIINTLICVIDDQERDTLSSSALKIVCNTYFIACGVVGVLV